MRVEQLFGIFYNILTYEEDFVPVNISVVFND